MAAKVFIGSAAGFAGDRSDAGIPVVGALAAHSGPRFIMYETLAERTLALCQLERRKDPARGYSPALDRLLTPVLKQCLAAGIRIVGNFGAANPPAAARRIAEMARSSRVMTSAAGFPRASSRGVKPAARFWRRHATSSRPISISARSRSRRR